MQELLIIGAGSDIAQATARKYAANGFQLILTARDADSLLSVAKDLEIRGAPKVSAISLDIEDPDSINSFLSNNPPLNPSGLIIAVGYLGEQEKAQSNNNEQAKILSVNYSSLIQLMEHFADKFEQRKSGFIVAISSVAGDRGRASNYHYGAAKAALSTYLSGLRNRLFKNNVWVTDIRPGFVATKMTEHLDLPSALTAQTEEVAERIFKAQKQRKDIVYIKPIWRLIMIIIRNIPESIFKRLSL